MNLGLLCVLQQLVVAPFPAEVGQEVTVRAVPAPGVTSPGTEGLEILVRTPDGQQRTAGIADVAGEIRFRPEVTGSHRFTLELGGVRVVAPLDVIAANHRWLYVITCVPLGLALAYRILRQRPAIGSPARAASASSPETEGG